MQENVHERSGERQPQRRTGSGQRLLIDHNRFFNYLAGNEGVVLKQYGKNENIKYLPIRKTDLVDLVELIVDHVFSDKIFFIRTSIDTLSIEERSIEAFLAHKEVPDPLNEYTITSYKYDSNHVNAEKYISLTIYSEHYSKLSVSDVDETWVLGKFQQINGFINKKFVQYKEEQRHIENDKAVAIEYKDKEIIIPETILQRLERRSWLEKIGAIVGITAGIATIIAIILKLW
jgi:hypothetical protein